jgi:hypothetical protein
VRRLVLLAFTFSFSTAADAADTVWHCWYEGDGNFALTCLLPKAELMDRGGFDGAEQLALQARWRERLEAGALAEAAHLVREHPESFAGQWMRIPLYSDPFEEDMAFARRLALAAMCGAGPGCAVAFDPLWATAETAFAAPRALR